MNLDDLRRQLIEDEALRLKPYRDTVGKLTIGVGRNLDDVGITEAEAMVLLDNDINRAVSDLDARLMWWRQMDDARQNVLVNMCFNMGIEGLLTFRNTLVAMQQGRYADAAAEMASSQWARQVGPRADRLIAIMRG